ncbi:sodium/myo-inositol cotransporter 2-like isoform X2 [Macrobrachium nipponense]|uniref:sodium/myo-inositol cotransporter 2-like isoform X2 n=1 Tax=Macrobrachium nipponense TaxID=159736 RepID=UPI0030C7A469
MEFLGGTRLTWVDVLVIALYFVFVLAVGLWVGTSLFASNIGSGHFIGLAGAGAASGIAAHGYEQGAIYGLVLLGWFFVPVYLASEVYTMPEYLRFRFGGQRIRVYLSCLSLALSIFTKIAADLYAGALFIQLSLNKNSGLWLYICVLFLLVVAAIFTIVGGLTTVVYTDLVQTVLMVCGSLILMIISFNAVGGYSGLVEKYPYAVASIRGKDALNRSCGQPPEDFMSLLRTTDSTKSEYPWTGMTFGLAIIQVWYWCTEQVIVQRTLASRSVLHAKGGTILAAYLKFLPLWVMVFPGMAARILFTDRVACADPEQCLAICGSPKGCTNSAYAELVLNLLPVGFRGLMVAVMMAALMSSLTSVFNSASTIFTIDLWTLLRKKICLNKFGNSKPTEKELIIVGRLFVILMVIASVLWIPIIQNTGKSQLFDYINMVISFLASPICAIYVIGLAFKRINEKGAFWGLMVGLLMGIVRFVAEFAYDVPACGSGDPDPRPELVKNVIGGVHYLHFCFLCWIVTAVTAFCVSIMTEPIPDECLYRLTFYSRYDPRVRRPIGKSLGSNMTENIEHSSTNEGSSTDTSIVVAIVSTGTSSVDKFKTTEEQQAAAAAHFLREPPFWKKVININCIICLTLSTFVYGFYA